MENFKLFFPKNKKLPPVSLDKKSFTIGRANDNRLQLSNSEEDTVVSTYHAEIVYIEAENLYYLRDLDSRNGTYLNDEKISFSPLKNNDLIMIGLNGPVLKLIQQKQEQQTKRTDLSQKKEVVLSKYDKLLKLKKKPKRIDKSYIRKKYLENPRKIKRNYILAGISIFLVIFIYNFFSTNSPLEEFMETSDKIISLEEKLREEEDLKKKLALLTEAAPLIEKNNLILKNYPAVATEYSKDIITAKIFKIAMRLGEKDLIIPLSFKNAVKNYINEITQGSLKIDISAGLERYRQYIAILSEILRLYKVPPIFSYIAFCESYLNNQYTNEKGEATGIWNISENVASLYGLKITEEENERVNITKSTTVAAKYLKSLIEKFGNRSFLLAMVSYRTGEANTLFKLQKLGDSEIQRNFWNFIRLGILGEEAETFLPRIFAIIIVSEDPSNFNLD